MRKNRPTIKPKNRDDENEKHWLEREILKTNTRKSIFPAPCPLNLSMTSSFHSSISKTYFSALSGTKNVYCPMLRTRCGTTDNFSVKVVPKKPNNT